ncbi:PepSY domain-containing protein [Bradyrhizobium sp. 157]|uniref:PepSY domain-containing protein n=1 Tax=Bradyrhizobium sp. 157 TaxID=2782631 RepID=UPI001FF8AEAA|nr:PepSY domain-containing protein [Bradyrhizobium sp. 157]MCK1638563.1 PepSY domain-containing protein [Bradyrhizobium sp. 157]
MRYLSITGTLLVMLSLGASLDPTLAKSKRETAALLQAKVTLSAAISVAQKEIPGGKPVDADLVATKGGKVIYSIELAKDDAHNLHKVSVDMQTGSVIEVTRKNVAAKDLERVKAVEQAKVTMIEAIALAEKRFPGGIIAAAEAKPRRGQVVYVVDIEQNGLRVVHVDPDSGRVLSAARKLDD